MSGGIAIFFSNGWLAAAVTLGVLFILLIYDFVIELRKGHASKLIVPDISADKLPDSLWYFWFSLGIGCALLVLAFFGWMAYKTHNDKIASPINNGPSGTIQTQQTVIAPNAKVGDKGFLGINTGTIDNSTTVTVSAIPTVVLSDDNKNAFRKALVGAPKCKVVFAIPDQDRKRAFFLANQIADLLLNSGYDVSKETNHVQTFFDDGTIKISYKEQREQKPPYVDFIINAFQAAGMPSVQLPGDSTAGDGVTIEIPDKYIKPPSSTPDKSKP